MILLTEAAQEQIIKLCHSSLDIGIRLEVVSGGCSGFQYKFSVAGLITEDTEKEVIIGAEGAALFVSHTDAVKIDGSTIDYVKELMSEKFVVTNTNSQCCGCGKSFT